MNKLEKSFIMETSNKWVTMFLSLLLFRGVWISSAREKKNNEILIKFNQELRIFIKQNNELHMLNGEHCKKRKASITVQSFFSYYMFESLIEQILYYRMTE